MRYQTEDAGPFFEAFVIAGRNKRLNEFSSQDLDARVMQSFVPVRDSQRLKVICKANELMKGSMIELVVDGILRDTYLHQKKQENNIIHTFDSGIYKSGKSLRRGKLTVQFNSVIPSHGEGQAKVGTIEVRLHRAHTSEVTSKKALPDPEEINSYQDLLPPWKSFGVTPDCDISLNGEDILNQSKRISCRRAFSQDRPGHAPWSILRFIYRTEDSLRGAGIMREEDEENSPFVTQLTNPLNFDEADDMEELSPLLGDVIKAESLEAEQLQESLERGRKRKHDDIDGIVNEIAFGSGSGANTPDSYSSRYRTPSKRTKAEVEALEKEVRELTTIAAENKRRCEAARAKLYERVRRKTELESKYEQLEARKTLAQEQIEKCTREEQLYMRQLHAEDTDWDSLRFDQGLSETPGSALRSPVRTGFESSGNRRLRTWEL